MPNRHNLPSPIIVGLGEALFDVFDRCQVLGGAPLNVAVHAHQAVGGVGGQGVLVGRVGSDERGLRLLAELDSRHMPTDYVQRDAECPTGTVNVTLRDGEPQYEIVRNVAWDRWNCDDAACRLAAACQAICFGSLAQRCETSREGIQQFLTAAKGAVRMFDVNLRQQFFNESILRKSCQLATAVKLNESELPVVTEQLRLAAEPRALIEAFDLTLVALTLGKRGTMLITSHEQVEDAPPAYERVADADSVGAGDACSAGLLVGLTLGWSLDRTLELANHMGAFVASQPGATPTLPEDIVALVTA